MTALKTSALLASAYLISSTAEANYAIGIDGARHLLNRTGFGASLSDIRHLAEKAPYAAVSHIVDAATTATAPTLPKWKNEPIMPLVALNLLDPLTRRERRQLLVMRKKELQLWQTEQLLETQTPLYERMVAFWHNLFSTPIFDVPEPRQFCQHIQLIRRHAMGNYREFLQDILQDPALVQAHDAHLNLRARANDRFARTLLNNMTLGPGVASDEDIKNMARLLTGISLSHHDGSYRYNPEQHLNAKKTVFSQTDFFEPIDAADIILSQPENAQWIVTKLWHEFINKEPDKGEIEALALGFREHYDIPKLLSELLNHPRFWSQNNRGALVKTPFDLIISSSRLFDQYLLSIEESFDIAQQLGMEIFNPQTPSGHRQHLEWITPQTLPLRQRLIRRLTRALESLDTELYTWSDDKRLLERVALPLPPRSEIAATDVLSNLAHYLGDPSFGLK